MSEYMMLIQAGLIGGAVSGIIVSLVWYFTLARKRDWAKVALKAAEVAPIVVDKIAQVANVLFDVTALQRGIRRESVKRAAVTQGSNSLQGGD